MDQSADRDLRTSLMQKIGLNKIHALRKMTADEILRMVNAFELTPEEKAYALSLARTATDLNGSRTVYSARNTFSAAVWVGGGSWRQLAMYWGVASSTIIQATSRLLPGDKWKRVQMRLTGIITHERIEVMWAAYIEHEDTVRHMPMAEIAQWLLDNSVVTD